MRFALALLCLLFLHAGSASGRLGDSEIQCADRYGPHKPDPYKTNRLLPDVPGIVRRVYHYKGWVVRVAFLNDVAVREEYAKHPMFQLKDFEVTAVLQAEAEGKGEWKERIAAAAAVTAGLTGRYWDRSDGAVATLPYGNFLLQFSLPIALKVEADAKREREARERAAVPKF